MVSTTGSIITAAVDSASRRMSERRDVTGGASGATGTTSPCLDQLGQSQVHNLLIGWKARAPPNFRCHLRLRGRAVAQVEDSGGALVECVGFPGGRLHRQNLVGLPHQMYTLSTYRCHNGLLTVV
jgi:hypothetical protein